MKRILPLLFICLMGCRVSVVDEVAPQPLFRTWKLQQIYITMLPPPPPFLVEFTRDGQLLYGADKARGGCCNPENFRVIDNKVQFYTAGPLPGICAQSLCVVTKLTAGVDWQIEQLDNRLVLRSGDKELNFVAQ